MRKIPVYPHPAAGWPALTASARKLMDYKAFTRGSRSVFSSNQPAFGFDCPGCAWPDHKSHKAIDVCETGIKVLASETMNHCADADFFAKYTVSELQKWTGYELEHSGRLSEPLIYDKATDHYVPIAWTAAFKQIAAQLKAQPTPDKALFYTSGRVTNEPAFMYQLLVRCYGTNNLPDCSNMCHEPTSVMLGKQIGVGKATVILDDFLNAKLILMFGQNPATNHPRMLEMLAHAHEQGCRIISINPMREQGLKAFRNPQKPIDMVMGGEDEMVDDVIQIQIGGDAALLTGLAKWLVENNRIDTDFVAKQTSGFDELAEWLNAQTWADIEQGCGIDKAAIIRVAKLVADCLATICTWGMGITQHVQGEDNVAMITNLLLLMGMMGVEGAGACPVRGHSNVQGDRTMGIHERPKASLLDNLERVFDHPMPRENGLDVVEGAQALIAGNIDVFFSMGGNYSVAAPDSSLIQQALTTTQMNVYVATKLNETMLYPGENNIILPCLGRTEALVTSRGEQFATIEDSICQIVPSKGTLKPISATLKSEAHIVAGIAQELFEKGSPSAAIMWQAMAEDYDLVRDYVADAIEGFEDFNTRIRAAKRAFHLYHPARHHEWHTDTKRAQLIVPKYPITYVSDKLVSDKQQISKKLQTSKELKSSEKLTAVSELVESQTLAEHTKPLSNNTNNKTGAQSESGLWQFTSVRSHDQFNTMIFGYEDRYRQTHRRDVLFMHPDEMQRLGWQESDKVIVERIECVNDEPQLRQLGPLVLTKMDIAANAVASYYPECNDLFNLGLHSPDARTPSYKSVTVSLKKSVVDSMPA